MQLSNVLKYLPQEHVKYQKKFGIGTKALKTKTVENRKAMAIVICIQRQRMMEHQVNSFFRVVSSIKADRAKPLIKSFQKLSRRKRKSRKDKKRRRPGDLLFCTATHRGIYTHKPAGLRMGKGKGSLIETCMPVRQGQIIFKISSRLGIDLIKTKINKAKKKLSSNSFELFFL